MREKEFYNWLRGNGLQKNTAISRVNNCVRVCQFEGDLDMHYDRDQCRELLLRLTYTTRDASNHNAPRHSIPINGDIYNGTATFKSAVNRYVDFRNDVHGIQSVPINNNLYHAVNKNGILQNKDFSKSVAEIITRFPENFTANDIHLLTDFEFCRNNFNCYYPVLKEVPTGSYDLRTITYIRGNRRFYDDIIILHSGHRFLITNDWYHADQNSNRNLFNMWIVRKTPVLAQIYQG